MTQISDSIKCVFLAGFCDITPLNLLAAPSRVLWPPHFEFSPKSGRDSNFQKNPKNWRGMHVVIIDAVSFVWRGCLMSDLQAGMAEQQTAVLSALEQARATIAELERRLLAVDERLVFNRELRAQAGLPSNGSQVQRLNDLRDEANRLDKEQDDLTI
jgi:hypothetical protein